jgi:hypothetical protein
MNDGTPRSRQEDELPASRDDQTKHNQLAMLIVEKSSDQERQALLSWAQGLLRIRNSNLTIAQKSRAALKLTAEEKIVWPVVKLMAAETKRVTWDERSTKARFGLVGAVAGVALFGGQGAGIAALGTAVGVPLWVVLGAGSTFAGVLIEELSAHLRRGGEK